MNIEVRLPQEGMAMQSGTIVEWLVSVGQPVAKGDVVAVAEADKTTFEIVAPASGTIASIVVDVDEEVPVRTVVALIDGDEASTDAGAPDASAPSDSAPAEVAAPDSAPSDSGRVIPLTGVRGRVAQRMHSSLQTMAQFSLSTTADVTELVRRREAVTGQIRVTYNHLVVRACALALGRHPRLNAVIEGDAIRERADINIGIAVPIADALIVPVLRNADRMTLADIAAASDAAVAQVQGGQATSDLVTGSTFTVSNLGSFGIETFTPIVNPPEVAILGVGRIVEQPTRAGGEIEWRQTMALSITVDHRAVDGVPAAQFLQDVVGLLADPATLFDA